MKLIEEEIKDYEELQSIISDEDYDVFISKDERSYIEEETYVVFNSLSDEQYKEYIK